MRNGVKAFLEHKYIQQLILGMTLFLCAVIFTELSIDEEPPDETGIAEDLESTALQFIFYLVNMFLLSFFMIEIILKLFAFGWLFLMSFINVFDSVVVFISFIFLVINVQVKFVGLLRILRLIKVITEMKRQSDEIKAKKEAIKNQKKQSSNMASHVERIIDFFDRQSAN